MTSATERLTPQSAISVTDATPGSRRLAKPVIGYVVRKFPVLSETFILNEILALEAMGMAVEIFALAPTRDPRFHAGVSRLQGSVHYLPGPGERSSLFRYVRRFAARHPRRYRRLLFRTALSRRPSLVWRFFQATWVAERARKLGVTHFHAHYATRSATVAQQASRLLGTGFSFTAHAFDIYRDADHRVIANKMSAATFAITVSDYNARFLRSLATGNPRIELVRNGIDLSMFSQRAETPKGPFRIVAVARLVEKKGLPILVDACRILRDRGHEFSCNIVGKGALSGPLQNQINSASLSKHVRLTGPMSQHDVVSQYHGANVVALPCLVGSDGNREGLPVSIVEALACGVPVIATPVTGIPEVVHDGINGLLVPERDAVALADAIERLMTDQLLYSRLAAAARKSVVPTYDQQLTSRQLYDLFQETAG